MKKREKNRYILNEESVDRIAEGLNAFCCECGVERKKAVRFRLSVEECLLSWKEMLPENSEITVLSGKRFSEPYFILEAPGIPYNPLAEEAEETDTYRLRLLARLGLAPEYSYSAGKNRLTFRLEKKAVNPLIPLAATLLLALICGFLGLSVLSADTRTVLDDTILSPVSGVFFRLLSGISGPMIFLSVISGIYGIGDSDTFTRVGTKLISRYLGITLFFICLTAGFAPLFGVGRGEQVTQGSGFKDIINLFLDIIPKNAVDPFLTGNTLQIIFLAVCIGVAMIFLGKKTEFLAQLLDSLGGIVQYLMKCVSKLIPFLIFVMIVKTVWSGIFREILPIAKFLLLYLIMVVFTCTVMLLYTAWKQKVSPAALLKMILPAVLVAFTTASSAASFDTVVDICKNKLGVHESLSGFGVPFGFVTMKATGGIYYLLLLFMMGEVYHTELSFGMLPIAVLLAFLMSIAIPPVPGGSAAVMAMFFAQMGVPADALGLGLSIDILLDFVNTGSVVTLVILELPNVAKSLSMQDRNALPRKKENN